MLRCSRLLVVLLAGWLVMGGSAQGQVFFESEAVFYNRNNRGHSPFVTGPEAVSAGNGDFGFQPGYRLTLGAGLNDGLQIDASYLQIMPWTASSSGVFNNAVIFDDTAGNNFVNGGLPANTLSGLYALRSAARSSLTGGVPIEALRNEEFLWGTGAMNDVLNQLLAAGVRPDLMAGADESSEGELLRPGASFSTKTRSNYRDFELNLGTNRNRGAWRFSAGYRNINLRESTVSNLSGVFDAVDIADGALPGDATNRPNDGLSHGALTNAGMTVLSPEHLVNYYAIERIDPNTGIIYYAQQSLDSAPDGFTASGPDGLVYLAWQNNGQARNQLNGGQVTMAYRLVDQTTVMLELLGKAGLYHNNVRGSVQETIAASGNDLSVYQRTLTDSKDTAAFAGNIGLRSLVGLTDYISLIAGYEVLFLSNVALSGDQAGNLRVGPTGATTYEVNTGGSMFAHGATLGLEVTF